MPSKAFKVDAVHEQVIKHLEALKLQGMASQYVRVLLTRR